MTISGKLKRVHKIYSPKPHDGVHRKLKSGKLKGPYLAYIGKKQMYHGLYGFYYRYSKRYGVKVYYSIKRKRPRKGYHTVHRHFRKMRRLWKRGYAAKPIKIVRVKVKLKGRHTQKAWGLVQKHLYYPEAAWKKYSKGYPYDWTCVNPREHPEHNPKGFKKFCKKIGNTHMKLGDVVYCTRRKHWYVCDIDAV